jgi:hypothetical protein
VKHDNAQQPNHGAFHAHYDRTTRRDFLARAGTVLASGVVAPALAAVDDKPPKKIAAIVTVYTHNSHADVIVSRLLQGYNLDGKEPRPNLKLVSLFTDQVPEGDKSRRFAAEHGFRIFPTIAETLTLGGAELAVDGVLLIGEHGKYETSETGQVMYPRRRIFEETVAEFRRSGRSVPVFSDKHLSWNWADAKWMYDASRELRFPLMAGSSLPVLWRRPPIEVELGAAMTEAVGISYHTLDAYGFHALEGLQCLCERRRGGEVGVAAVQCLEGPAVWKARDAGRFDGALFEAAMARREHTNRFKGRIEDAVKDPILFLIEYRDGFRAAILTLNYANDEWCIAWRQRDRKEPLSTLFWTQEARPFGHFTFLTQGIEQMMHTGKPAWPVERTLLTTGTLDALLISKLKGGSRIDTPHLAVAYQPTFTWREPPAPPPDRPINDQ